MKIRGLSAWLFPLAGWIFGVAVLGGSAVAEMYRGQNSTAMVSVLTLAAAILTALIAFGGTTYAKVLEQRAATLKAHRERKAEFYDKLVGLVMDYMIAEKTQKSVNAKEAMKRGYEFNRGAIVWASDDVIRAWSEFRRNASDDSRNNARLIADLFLAMRADLGHNVDQMSRRDILSVFVNDIEKYPI